MYIHTEINTSSVYIHMCTQYLFSHTTVLHSFIVITQRYL